MNEYKAGDKVRILSITDKEEDEVHKSMPELVKGGIAYVLAVNPTANPKYRVGGSMISNIVHHSTTGGYWNFHAHHLELVKKVTILIKERKHGT